MVLFVDQPNQIEMGVLYHPLSKHRGRPSQGITVWTVKLPEEVACFTGALNSGWLASPPGWGMQQGSDKHLVKLGKNVANDALKFAKFVSSLAPLASTWHGYPCDYQRNAQDRPPAEILLRWREMEAIEKHQVLKIRRGKPCAL